MLGRLLHLGSGGAAALPSHQHSSTSRPVSSLESVQEDLYTRNLLFPDAQALFQHRNDQVFPLSTTPATPSASANPNAFDSNDDIDLDVRDVRVIMMQDTLGPTNATLLFDSQPAPTPSPTTNERPPVANQDPRRTPASSRKGSLTQLSRPLSIQSDGVRSRQGAFDRRGSLHGRAPSYAETDSQRASREYREELATFSSCIFGNSELMAYKGTSTKVHVVPSDARGGDGGSAVLGDGRSSMGRSSIRSSKLSQSFSSQNVSPTSMPAAVPYARPAERKKVLITRLFPVNLPNDELDTSVSPQNRFSDDNAGFPFPASGDDLGLKTKKNQPKQRRTPMYAVVLVIQLPPPKPYHGSMPKSAYRESSSYNEQDFFSSSFGSTRPSAISMAGPGMYGDFGDTPYSVDMEDRIDSLTQHWDIIMRTLTHLQSVVATTLRQMLLQTDVASPEPSLPVAPHMVSPRGQVLSDRRSGEISRPKAAKSTFRLLALGANCLSNDDRISLEVNTARARIVTGLKAARVVTGQGRWGIWRDEAIWTAKWAQSSQQGQFLHQLLTGFLATHTDWMQALCPPSYRRRLLQQKKSRQEDDLSLPARTVIVSDNKMAARRLIFLLSAFLPASQHHLSASRAHRPSTSTSIGGFSHSPPTYVVPVLREESLRRKINRRTGTRRTSHSRTTSQSMKTGAVPSQLAHLGLERLSLDQGHERRPSDASSIRTTSLALPGGDPMLRKSSAATTATIVPETTTAHFSTVQQVDSLRRPRPTSIGSVATDDLKRSLRRGESSGHVSTTSTDSRSQSSRWGSVISAMWSPKRRDSTSMSSAVLSIDPKSPTKGTVGRRDKLSDMVREVSVFDNPRSPDFNPSSQTTRALNVDARRDSTRRERPSFSLADRTPDPTGAFESPVKTSINEDDGVIDVDVPFPDYITSFESAISSPSSSGYLSTPGIVGGLDLFEQSTRVSVDGDLPLNAAGWIAQFNPDFTLQAIPPQDDLLEQVKTTLRSEPTPSTSQDDPNAEQPERWVDVGSVVIANTLTRTVSRLNYRRLVKAKSAAEKTGGASGAPHTPSIAPYETPLEEEWIEDTLFKADEGLVEAIEKIVDVNRLEPTKENSTVSSGANSETNGNSDSGGAESSSDTNQPPPNSIDVPRVQCKTVILSALEDLIRHMLDSREKSDAAHNGSSSVCYRDSLIRDAIQDWATALDSSD